MSNKDIPEIQVRGKYVNEESGRITEVSGIVGNFVQLDRHRRILRISEFLKKYKKVQKK